MNGVMMPDASAGSNQVGASETWTPHVSWSGEAAIAAWAPVIKPSPVATKKSRRPIVEMPPAGYGSRPIRPELIPRLPVGAPFLLGLVATLDQPRTDVARLSERQDAGDCSAGGPGRPEGYSTSSPSRRMTRAGLAVAWTGMPASKGSYQIPQRPSFCGATTSHS